MLEIVKIIENDDLENFKIYFKAESWQNSITTIANYAGLSQYNKEITYNDADCFKYALHCNADKIFDYLLPLVDTNKHGDNYGWPLLAMAIKNKRYDYADKIINHNSFNPYPRYHTNCFSYIDSYSDTEQHINFLFKYLEKFDRWSFEDEHLIYVFTHLVCYNEYTFNKFDSYYKEKMNDNSISILDIFENNFEYLGEEIFGRKYSKFIIEKLNKKQIAKIIEVSFKQTTYFMELFQSENAKEGITYLLQCPELFLKHFENNEVVASYLTLECILLLIENGFDIWKEGKENIAAIDFILNNDNINEDQTWYFINKYPKQIYERLQANNRQSNLQIYCHQKILQDELPLKIQKNSNAKI